MKNKLLVVKLLLVALMSCYIFNIKVSAGSLEGNLIDNYTEIVPVSGSILIGAGAAESDLDLTLSDMLIYSIQDEYLAKSRNELIIDKFGRQEPFINILKSELAHIAYLQPLLAKYKVPVPPDNSRQYVKVPFSLRESFEAAAQGEIANIRMYERFLMQNIPDDVREVFTKLRNGSIKHMV